LSSLWILHEALCHLFDYFIKEFAFIGHVDDATGNAPSYFFLFGCQHAKYQLVTNVAQVQQIIKILQKFQPLAQFGLQISICHFS
jgi:hypothetical protein